VRGGRAYGDEAPLSGAPGEGGGGGGGGGGGVLGGALTKTPLTG